MDEQELRNFLRSQGEETNEVAVPSIEITERLIVDICDLIDSEGLDSLIENVGTVANAFKTENDYSCSTDVLQEAAKLIHTGLVRLYMEITSRQDDVKTSLAKVDRQYRHKFRKYYAVLFFLIYQSFTEIERQVTAEAHNISIANAAKDAPKRKKKTAFEDHADSQYQFWFHWRAKIVQEVEKLLSPPMHEIWEEAPEGSNFLRCITLAFCTTIKNKTKHLRTMDDEMEDIFDILGILSGRYDDKGVLSRVIPLLKVSEEAAAIVAQGVHRMVDKASPDQASVVVTRAYTETVALYSASIHKESSHDRGFSTFMTQMSTLEPQGTIDSLAIVIQFLESDSHIVRNAVLTVAAELMNWTWKKLEDEAVPTDGGVSDERPHTRDNWLSLRQKLLNDFLLNHMRDLNSHVRSKAISLLADIVKAEKITPAEAIELMKNVKLRLLDKTVTTRKNATTLVIDLVKKYPHMATSTEKFVAKMEEKRNEIISTIQTDEPNAAMSLWYIIQEFHLHIESDSYSVLPRVKEHITDPDAAIGFIETALKEKRFWDACEALSTSMKKWSQQFDQILTAIKKNENDADDKLYITFFKSMYPEVFPEDLNSLELEERHYVPPEKVIASREFLTYLQCCYKMKAELENCTPSLKKLLELGTTTDKKEAVMFYAAICNGGFKPSQSVTVSIINALAQLNADELSDFVGPFIQIFIGSNNQGPVVFVKKLLSVVENLTENDVENLSGMIGELYKSQCLNQESIKVLWDAYSLSAAGWEEKDSRSAAYLIGIIGQIERKIVTTNLNQLIEIGIGPRGLEDYELAKITLQTILLGCRIEPTFVEPEIPKGRSKTAKATSSKKKTSEVIKFPPTHALFPSIVELIENGMKIEGDWSMDMMYPRVVELSLQIIYRMCTAPGEVVMKFLPNVHNLIFVVPESNQSLFKNSERLLFRYLNLGKALLGAHINYYEQIVSAEIKERKSACANSKSRRRPEAAVRQRGRRVNDSSASSVSSLHSSVMNQSNQDANNEMDVMIGTIGFDSEADIIKNYISKLLDQGFFRQFRVHVLYLCQDFTPIKSINLKVACVQALAKLMLVCETSVTKSIDIFIRLWNSELPFVVKLEILKASIRLTVRFPNQMEKMNDCFSAGLADKDTQIRKACMDYIQYLALSDLLKVREQLSDTAACLCNGSHELREMAKDFINEIAEKDNVLQNSIPDIISRLSSRADISQENFQNIMKILLTKIKKEKQLGGLIERIVGRFKGVVPARVCQDSAFCLTQIQHNDKTLKILKDNFPLYADKLGDAFVWDSFMEVLGSFKNMKKPELKVKLEEWERDLNESRSKCEALDTAEKTAKKKNEKARRVMEPESSSDEENVEEDQDDEGKGDSGSEEMDDAEIENNKGNSDDAEVEENNEEEADDAENDEEEADDAENNEENADDTDQADSDDEAMIGESSDDE